MINAIANTLLVFFAVVGGVFLMLCWLVYNKRIGTVTFTWRGKEYLRLGKADVD